MKIIKRTIYLAAIFLSWETQAQSVTPDLQNADLWRVVNRDTKVLSDQGKKGIQFSEKPNAGLMILKNMEFSEGTLEFDVKGRNLLQKSFVGIAFHIQNDSTYDAIYFRPFNFKNEEIPRRSRSVQYISNPKYDWPILRQNFPGKYENRVTPVPEPDDWFHVKVVVAGKSVTVFVNNAAAPSLEVTKLTDTRTGTIALWTGHESDGSFANLVVTPAGSIQTKP